jgi:hypothetical protein
MESFILFQHFGNMESQSVEIKSLDEYSRNVESTLKEVSGVASKFESLGLYQPVKSTSNCYDVH